MRSKESGDIALCEILWSLVESQLLGVDTLKRDMTASADLLDDIASGFEDRSFVPPIIARHVGLADAVEGYRSVVAGTHGRVVIDPARG